MTLFAILDYSSVLVFAATGALVASRAQLDIIGFVFLASLTAVGGGTLRDVLLDRNPVFWIADPTYLFVAAATAVIVFFTAHLLESRYTVLEWLDAAALSFAVAAGSGIAVAVDAPATIVVVMGVIMVMSVPVMVMPAHQEQRARDIAQKAVHRVELRAREIDAHRIDQAQEGFDRDADCENAEDQRRGKTREVADLAGAEAVARIVAMLLGIAIGERG